MEAGAAEKPIGKTLEHVLNSGELPMALRDVLSRTPKSISIEFDKHKGEKGWDDDGGWSGNIYKYTF